MARKGGQATLFVQFGRKKSLNINCCQIRERGKVQNMSYAKNTIRNGCLPLPSYEPLILFTLLTLLPSLTLLTLFKQLSSKKAIYGLTGLTTLPPSPLILRPTLDSIADSVFVKIG